MLSACIAGGGGVFTARAAGRFWAMLAGNQSQSDVTTAEARRLFGVANLAGAALSARHSLTTFEFSIAEADSPMDVAVHSLRQDESTSAAMAWWAVFVLTILAIVSFLDRQIISLLVGPIRADLGISDFQIGLLQGFAFAAFYALFGIPMGWAVDHYSRRGAT